MYGSAAVYNTMELIPAKLSCLVNLYEQRLALMLKANVKQHIDVWDASWDFMVTLPSEASV